MKKFINAKFAAIVIALGCMLLFGAESCSGGETAPTVDSDNGSTSYVSRDGKAAEAPVDRKLYTVTGEVVGPVNSVTRQVKPAEGSVSGSLYGNYGSLSGSFFGPVVAGKGFVRLLVSEAVPSTSLAQDGSVSILKVSDTKATALLVGDVVTFKCRRDFEAIAPVVENQHFDANEVGTWELDYCRMESAVISVRQ